MSIKENIELLSKVEDIIEQELKKGFIDTQNLTQQNKQKDSSHSPKIRNLAEGYAKTKGFDYQHPTEKVKVNPEFSAKIAEAYHNMPHDPNHPQVKAAYKALIDETKDQFNHIKNSGLKISKIKPGQANPYPNSEAMHRDVRENNHLWFYPTEQGFGSGEGQSSDHPMLQGTGEHIGDHHLLANDMFRIVHDYFGHAKEGTGFGPHGEENAWMEHSKMYSPLARKALTTETRGQNSWVNFGPHGEHNRKNPAKTIYAEQKAGLLPDWAHEPLSGINKSEEEYEGLEKGSLQRRMPFNPKEPKNETIAREQRNWTHDEDQDVRDTLPKMEGNARARALRKLTAQTHVRKHPETGERMYLMHRGMGKEEFTGANKNGKTTHEQGTRTSWSPDRASAENFGDTVRTVSAWIPESALIHNPNQFNSPSNLNLAAKKNGEKRGNDRSVTEREEKEWIVEHGPEGFHHANLDALTPHKSDAKINARKGRSGDKASYRAKDLKQIQSRETHKGQYAWMPKEKLAASEKIKNSLRKDEDIPQTPKKPKGAKQEEVKVGEALSNLSEDKQTTAGMNSRIYSIPSAEKMKRSQLAQKTGQIPSSINVYGSHYPILRVMPDNKTILVHTSPYGKEGKTEELLEKMAMQMPEHFPDAHVIEIHHPDYRHSAKIMRMRNPNSIAEYLKHASENHPDENYRQHAAEAYQHLSSLNKIKKAEYGKPIHAKRTENEGFDYEKNIQGRLSRLHNYLTSIGLSPDLSEDTGRDLGSKNPTSLTINLEGDPHDQQVLHEAAHAMLTGPGQTLQEYQRGIGEPGFKGKITQTQNSASLKATHGGGMPEQTAQHMEAGIARRSGIEPFRSPKRGKPGSQEELARTHAKKTLGEFDQGYYKFDPFTGEKELQANPNTLINAKAAGNAGLFGKIRNKLIEQRKAKANIPQADLEDMAANEKDVTKVFNHYHKKYPTNKIQKAEPPKYKTGDRVAHPKLGPGTVRQNHGDGHLTVGFDSGGSSLSYKGQKVHHTELNQPIKKNAAPSARTGNDALTVEQLEPTLQKPFKSKKQRRFAYANPEKFGGKKGIKEWESKTPKKIPEVAKKEELKKWEGKALKSGALALALAHGAHYMNKPEQTSTTREVAAEEQVSPQQKAVMQGREEAEKDVADIMRRNYIKSSQYQPSHIAMKQTIKSNPELMQKYGFALKLSKPAFHEVSSNHPSMSKEVGEAYYDTLHKEFQGNDEYIDHAWRNGIKATKAKFGLENQ